jgi:isocitrate dehydrogenase
MSKHNVVLIKGDGIGPEIADAVVSILESAGAPINWIEKEAGLGVTYRAPSGLPEDTLEAITKYSIALKGPTTTPVGSGHKSVNVTLRKKLDLYSNVRPSRSLPGLETRYKNIDLIIVRENIEDTYGGIEHMQSPDVAQLLKLNTRPGSLKIARYAFEMARAMNRPRVMAVHKANIHKISDGMFLECFREVAREYPEIQVSDILVDNVCMQLVSRPEQFDVLVCPNLFGDILSDLCAGLVGGLGVAPGGNIGDKQAVFEAVHGSAPDIAGMGLANPTALLQSSVMMLQHIGLHDTARRVHNAFLQTLKDGVRTKDLGGNAGTKEFTNVIIGNLEKRSESVYEGEPVRVQTSTKNLSRTAQCTVETVGVDCFINHPVLPSLPETIGKFTLTLISNRGTKVWPGTLPDITMVDIHRCRYKATSGTVTSKDIAELMIVLDEHGFNVIHTEKLLVIDGQDGYSKAQGE